tara:strand:- start:444 stop:908 length:465 start_codon:yes stop_codon:yes gene_type:complete
MAKEKVDETIISEADFMANYLEENKDKDMQSQITSKKLVIGLIGGFFLSLIVSMLFVNNITDSMGLTDHASIRKAEKTAKQLTALGNDYNDSQLVVEYAKRDLPSSHSAVSQIVVAIITILFAAIIYMKASDQWVRESILNAESRKLYKSKYKS